MKERKKKLKLFFFAKNLFEFSKCGPGSLIELALKEKLRTEGVNSPSVLVELFQ